jgi:hypothetical protein
MVMQVKQDQNLPTVAYEIDTAENLIKAMRTVYNLGPVHTQLSVKEDYEKYKAKLLAGYFKGNGTEIEYLWDDSAPKVDLSFAEEVEIQNTHDFDTVVNYKAHGRSHKLEDGIAAEFVGEGKTFKFVPVNNFDWKTGVAEVLKQDLKEKEVDSTPKKKKAKTSGGTATSQASPDNSTASASSTKPSTTLGEKALHRLQSKVARQATKKEHKATVCSTAQSQHTLCSAAHSQQKQATATSEFIRIRR